MDDEQQAAEAVAADTGPVPEDKRPYSEYLANILARKSEFEKGWWKRAENAQKFYDAPDSDDEAKRTPFNIVYANTEILLPALYSATPTPDCTGRAKTEIATACAQAAEKMLHWLLDDNTPGQESFDSAMEGATLSALVPGAGGVRLRHYPGDSRPVRWEEFKFNQLVWAKCSKWSRAPWIAFIHVMRRDEIVREFKLSEEEQALLNGGSQASDTATDEKNAETIVVYEYWNKATRETCFLCDGYEPVCLSLITDDPLALPGFYPTPGLLTLVRKPGDMDPTPLLDYYYNQAEELNRVTVRLNRVLSAIRVRGAYDSQLGDVMQRVLAAGETENKLEPINRIDMQQGSLEDRIWLLPIDKLIIVAQQLYAARQQIMSVIYQITGLADIVRGASVASETATAQELKNKWGTLRLKRMQRTVQLYIRDLLRLAIDATAAVTPPVVWMEATGLPYKLEEAKQQDMLRYQQVAQQAQAAGQQPPPPPPDVPSWETIVSTLADDTKRSFAIDVETASTVDSEDKADVTAFMGAFAQVMQGLEPLMALGPQGAEAAKTLVLAILKRFRLGREVESAFRQLQAPPPAAPGADPKLEADKQKAQLELKVAQEQHAVEMERLAMEKDKIRMERELMVAKHQAAMMKAMTPPVPPQPAAPGARPRPPR